MSTDRIATRVASVSCALALAAVIFLLAFPAYSGARETVYANGAHSHVTNRATMVQVNGDWVLLPMLFPVLVAAVPLLLRTQPARIICTIVLFGFVIIAGFSIGLFYLPAALAMVVAACVAPLGPEPSSQRR